MKDWQDIIKYGFMIVILAAFPVFTTIISGAGDNQVSRHLAFLNGDSPFFNPWQYRVFAPFLIELLASSIKLFTKNITDEILYLNIFRGVRFVQHIIIFLIAWKFYKHFTKNKDLLLTSILILATSIGSATYNSDYSLNTYFDVIFYLLAAFLIFSEKNIFWFLPLTFVAALNRETSILIPFLLILNYQNFISSEKTKRYRSVLLGCIVIFSLTFILIRIYYGYQPPTPIGIETGWPMLQFNFTDSRTITNLLATLTILPLYALLNITKTEKRLQILFWLIVPIWFGLHFWLVWANETRLFLVPIAIVFIPILIDLIQKSFEKSTIHE